MIKRYISNIKSFAVAGWERIMFSGKLASPEDNIVLLKLDKLGDYIVFRNFIEETYNAYRGSKKLILCGNDTWKDFAEKMDGRYVSGFIWIDVNKLESSAYRFSIYRKLRQAKSKALWHCSYSRTTQSDMLALHSGASEIIGHSGDMANIPAKIKEKNDLQYTTLVPNKHGCMFEFERNKEFFEYVLQKKIELKSPVVKSEISKGNKHILIFPGAGHSERRWSTGNFALCSKLLHEKYNLPVLICGAENEKILGEEIRSKSGDFVTNEVDMYSIEEYIKPMKQAKLVICNDSAPLHLAMALDIPSVCISNGNYYQRFCPYPAHMHKPLLTIFPEEFNKLLKDESSIATLLCKESKRDINTITVDQVIAAINKSNLF